MASLVSGGPDGGVGAAAVAKAQWHEIAKCVCGTSFPGAQLERGAGARWWRALNAKYMGMGFILRVAVGVDAVMLCVGAAVEKPVQPGSPEEPCWWVRREVGVQETVQVTEQFHASASCLERSVNTRAGLHMLLTGAQAINLLSSTSLGTCCGRAFSRELCVSRTGLWGFPSHLT